MKLFAILGICGALLVGGSAQACHNVQFVASDVCHDVVAVQRIAVDVVPTFVTVTPVVQVQKVKQVKVKQVNVVKEVKVKKVKAKSASKTVVKTKTVSRG